MEAKASKEETQHVLRVLEALKTASNELQSNPNWANSPASNSSSAIKILLELQTESNSILSNDPHLSNLSLHLSNLKELINTLENSSSRHGLRSFLTRRVSNHEISRVAGSIVSEIQDWIDHETILNLSRVMERWLLESSPLSAAVTDDELVIDSIDQFAERLNRGFNTRLQDLVLKLKVFQKLETVLCRTSLSKSVRERAAFAVSQLIKFNKDVFVGQILMGRTVRALISMASLTAMEVLCSLIKRIKSPLVDDIEANGEIPKIISLLGSSEFEMQLTAMNCVLEIGYFGRKEAIEAMLNAGLIKKLVELQRSVSVEKRENREVHAFGSCVARFAVQVEVGEGLRQREKRAFKQEILKRVREASVSDAEAATIVAEVLWGSSP